MGEKDITENVLFNFNDVFADIFNGLFFNGEQVILPKDLKDIPGISSYMYQGKTHQQVRDVTKLWEPENIRLCLFGIENQTNADPDIALRVMGYDGAAYRSQLLKPAQKERYPVISIVLFFGNGNWNCPKSLKERLNIPKKLEPFVNDYRVHVFEIPNLEKEQVKNFRSDFRIVADYFVQVRSNGTYSGSDDELNHVWEVLQLLKALTNDERFLDVELDAIKQGGCSMYSVIDQWIATGESKGIKIGEANGIKIGEANGIKIGEANGIKIGEANGENRMAEKVQRNIQTLLENRQITEETAALLRSITL